MIWEPWYKYQINFTQDRLQIDEPPCKSCANWAPHRQYDKYGKYTGVRLCCSETMHWDFSCYREIKNKTK